MKKFALYKSLLIIICLLGVTACGDGEKKEEVSIGKSNEKTQLITVDTLVLKKRSFQKQIVCNGKLRAVVKSDLAFNGSGTITAIHTQRRQNKQGNDASSARHERGGNRTSKKSPCNGQSKH